MSKSIVSLKISSLDKLTEHWIAEGENSAMERIIELLEEHVWQLDIAPDKSWEQRCRCGFYGVFNEHLITLIKGEK